MRKSTGSRVEELAANIRRLAKLLDAIFGLLNGAYLIWMALENF